MSSPTCRDMSATFPAKDSTAHQIMKKQLNKYWDKLGATVVETAQYVLQGINQIVSVVDVWNGICFYFDIDHITPVHGAFSMKKSTDFWDVMTIHHHSNLQILQVKGNTLIAVMENMYNSDGKFLRWKHVSHNVKQIHNTAAHEDRMPLTIQSMVNEGCRKHFNRRSKHKNWRSFRDEVISRIILRGNVNDDVSFGSETEILPD